MQQYSQKENTYQESEFDLIKLINNLLARKLLIFGLTSFITLLSIIYSLNLTPNYKVTTSITSPSDRSIINLNKLELTSETKKSIFSDYLTTLSSQEFQIKVFDGGGYLTALNPENGPIDNVERYTANFLSSIIVEPPVTNISKTRKAGNLIEKPYSVSMQGSNAKIITQYLNELVATTDKVIIKTMMDIIAQKIAIRLDQILIERDLLLEQAGQNRFSKIERIKEEDGQKIRQINDQIDSARYKAKENRLNQIAVLTDAVKLAKSLGIVENNFKLITGNGASSDLTIAFGLSKDLPEWYLYGEKALIQRIALLENRASDDPFISELITLNNQLNEVQNNSLLKTLETRQDDSPFVAEIINLDIEKLNLESTIIDSTGIRAIQISQTAITPTTQIWPNKKMIVLLTFISSFMVSILLALVMIAIKPDELTLPE